jgi:hypothetical protein
MPERRRNSAFNQGIFSRLGKENKPVSVFRPKLCLAAWNCAKSSSGPGLAETARCNATPSEYQGNRAADARFQAPLQAMLWIAPFFFKRFPLPCRADKNPKKN